MRAPTTEGTLRIRINRRNMEIINAVIFIVLAVIFLWIETKFEKD